MDLINKLQVFVVVEYIRWMRIHTDTLTINIIYKEN